MKLRVVSRMASDMQGEMLPLFKIALHVQNIFFRHKETKSQVSQTELLLSAQFHGKQQEWLYKSPSTVHILKTSKAALNAAPL